MTTYYIRSTDGNNADSGSTWALALDTIEYFATVDAAGDVIYLSDAHSEQSASTLTLAFAGTLASPTIILCVDDSAEPPTALANTASIGCTTGSGLDIVISGTFYMHGVTIYDPAGATATITIAGNDQNYQVYNDCSFVLDSTGALSRVIVGSGSSNVESTVRWVNVDFKAGNTTSGIIVSQADFSWSGGSILSGMGAAAALIVIGTDHTSIYVEGVDMTNLATTTKIFSSDANGVGKAVIRNCTMPSSWTGNVGDKPTGFNVRFEMYNCDAANAATNYRCEIKDYAGTLTTDDTLYRSPGLGASSWMYNGTTQIVGISHKYAATANALWPIYGFRGIELVGLNTVLDPTTSHVVSCFFTTPGQADFTPLTDQDIGLVVQYLGTADQALGRFADSLSAVLSTASDCAADSAGDWDDALGAWATSTAYSVGAVVRPTTRNGKTYYCSVAGTSHASTEPTWGTTEGGETTDDGTLRWRCMHRQKMVVTLDSTAGKVKERGFLQLTPVLYLASAVAWVDPIASITSS